MSKVPIVYTGMHRIKFSELDPYNHVSTGNYATFFADHRMEGLREYLGWDLKVLGTLPFRVWVRRMEIDYLRPGVAIKRLPSPRLCASSAGPTR